MENKLCMSTNNFFKKNRNTEVIAFITTNVYIDRINIYYGENTHHNKSILYYSIINIYYNENNHRNKSTLYYTNVIYFRCYNYLLWQN